MNSVYGDSELISSCLGAPDVLLGAPVAPEVPGTLGSLGQTVDTSPHPPLTLKTRARAILTRHLCKYIQMIIQMI